MDARDQAGNPQSHPPRASIPLVSSPAATFPNPERPRTPSVAAVQRGNLVVEVTTWCCAELNDLYGRIGQVEWGGRLRGRAVSVADVAGRRAPDLAGTGAGNCWQVLRLGMVPALRYPSWWSWA
jgi:hypothetical protein